MRKIFLESHIFFFFACVAWLGSNALAAQAASPTDQIRSVVDEVLALLQDERLSPDARRKGIREVISPYFDFRAMSQSTLAQSWKKATPEQQDRFVELYPKMLENVYIVAMEEYSGEKVKYGKEKVRGKRSTVETFVVQPDGPEIPILYRMRLNQDRWLAYDVVIEGVSLISNYRSSFRRIAEVEGMDALLDQLQQKIASQLQDGT